MKRFQITPWDNTITQLDVRPNDEPKYSDLYMTWDDAHAALVDRAKKKLRGAGAALRLAEDELVAVKGMRP